MRYEGRGPSVDVQATLSDPRIEPGRELGSAGKVGDRSNGLVSSFRRAEVVQSYGKPALLTLLRTPQCGNLCQIRTSDVIRLDVIRSEGRGTGGDTSQLGPHKGVG